MLNPEPRPNPAGEVRDHFFAGRAAVLVSVQLGVARADRILAVETSSDVRREEVPHVLLHGLLAGPSGTPAFRTGSPPGSATAVQARGPRKAIIRFSHLPFLPAHAPPFHRSSCRGAYVLCLLLSRDMRQRIIYELRVCSGGSLRQYACKSQYPAQLLLGPALPSEPSRCGLQWDAIFIGPRCGSQCGRRSSLYRHRCPMCSALQPISRPVRTGTGARHLTGGPPRASESASLPPPRAPPRASPAASPA